MILRTKFHDGYEVNRDIGKEYHLIGKEVSPAKFEESAKIVFKDNGSGLLDDTYAFIVYKNGKHIDPLYKDFNYYILTEGGRLFANLTFK